MTFDDHVAAALDSLPPDLAAALQNIAVVVEDEHPDDPDLFGLYEGTPLSERAFGDTLALPDRITIFYRPLVRAFRTPAAIRREVRKTVVHELAHVFGLDDDDIEAEGY